MDKRKTVWKRAFGPAIFLVLYLVAGNMPLAATDITGTIKLPDGTSVNGSIEFTLSQPARTTTPPQLFARRKTTCAVTSGVIAGGCTVQGNDTLDPAGTFYSVRILDSNNIEILPSTNYTISGAAVDLGSLAIAASATLQLPSGTVSGNATITGNLTVSGTTTLNGGLTWLPPFNVVNTVAGTVPFTVKGASGQTADLFQLQNNTGTNLVGVASNGDVTASNSADSILTFRLDSGSVSGQITDLIFADRGVDTWRVRKNETNGFSIIDIALSAARLSLNPLHNVYKTGSAAGNHVFERGDSANDIFTIFQDGSVTMKNSADAAITLKVDAGSTTGQIAALELADRGTVKYQLQKNTANDFALFDVAASLSRVAFAASGSNTYRPAGSGHHDFVSPAGALRLRLHGDADKISFGSAVDTNLYRASANLLKTDDSLEVAGGTITLGAVTITVASGAPSGGCTTGSLYLRTDGGAGTTLYVCQATAWAAK